MKVFLASALVILSNSIFAKDLWVINTTNYNLHVVTQNAVGREVHGTMTINLNPYETQLMSPPDLIDKTILSVLVHRQGIPVTQFLCPYDWQASNQYERVEVAVGFQGPSGFNCTFRNMGL